MARRRPPRPGLLAPWLLLAAAVATATQLQPEPYVDTVQTDATPITGTPLPYRCDFETSRCGLVSGTWQRRLAADVEGMSGAAAGQHVLFLGREHYVNSDPGT